MNNVSYLLCIYVCLWQSSWRYMTFDRTLSKRCSKSLTRVLFQNLELSVKIAVPSCIRYAVLYETEQHNGGTGSGIVLIATQIMYEHLLHKLKWGSQKFSFSFPWNGCSLENIIDLFFSPHFNIHNIEIHKVTLPFVMHRYETWSLYLKEERNIQEVLGVINRLLFFNTTRTQ
jgi:hypothetical protein